MAKQIRPGIESWEEIMTKENRSLQKKEPMADRWELREGLRAGLPIGIGYFAVAFSLGIAARNAGMTVLQGFMTSILCNASAGQYAFFTQVAAGASLLEVAVMTLITNARYLLMSCALSQRLAPGTAIRHRLLLGTDVTDEIFGISVARPGFLNPWYAYGAMLASAPFWAAGTAAGILAGSLLPARIVSGLSVALYGMFLAVIIPPARTNRVIGACILAGFAASGLADRLPLLDRLSVSNRTLVLTVVIAAAAALLFPVKEDTYE